MEPSTPLCGSRMRSCQAKLCSTPSMPTISELAELSCVFRHATLRKRAKVNAPCALRAELHKNSTTNRCTSVHKSSKNMLTAPLQPAAAGHLPYHSTLCPDRALLRLRSCGNTNRNTNTRASQSAKAYAMCPWVDSFTDFCSLPSDSPKCVACSSLAVLCAFWTASGSYSNIPRAGGKGTGISATKQTQSLQCVQIRLAPKASSQPWKYLGGQL